MDKHISLSPCPFCEMGLTLDIDEEGGVAILHSLKGEKNCWFPSVVEIEMPVGTTLDEMVEILNRRPIQESFEHALVGASLVAAARLQDKDFEIQNHQAELARLREQEINYENDIFLGQPIEYWMRIKAQLDADNSDSYVREVLLLEAELARRDEELALTEKKLCNIDRSARVEVARRDEIIKQQGEVSVIFQEQLSRRDEIIARLKEDAERLAGKLISMYADEMYECSYCGHGVSKSPDEIEHAPDCPITLHRALMKEIER